MKRNHNPQQQVLIGLIMAVLGIAFLLDNLNLFAVGRLLSFWPTVFIAVGLFKLFQTDKQSDQFVGACLVFFGGVLLLRHLGYLDFRFRDLWPLGLIGLGVLVMLKGGHRWPGQGEPVIEVGGDRINIATVVSGNQTRVDSQNFVGGDVSVIMAGAELDMRRASINGTAVLKVFVALGALQLKVPLDWSISVNGTPLAAGIEDKTVPPAVPTKRLIIEGTVALGAVEIRN
ncbi:DUF5668 domain-containing protein [Paucibacter sp. APW11]|uniref:DUF5668 domain-containing protein n=1 Tax=Roseateles aquae TaxID=3077235 RepID=A0ABU3PDY5_9BURK|nr:DUF5668 domain-containing protein [Paucibacter sp. APW11]MDT9000759.1 DUF5668 domain-containing protein [Paucibacter sp. APW11]